MRSRTRQSIKRSLCGLLAVLMSLQGMAVASNTFAQVAGALEPVPAVVAADDEDMPCHDMMMADESDAIVLSQADTGPDENCDGDCCGPDHGCGMAYCMAGSFLAVPGAESHLLPYLAMAANEFLPPALGRITPGHGPPLRPPIV